MIARLTAETAPAFGDDDGVARILRIVFHRSWKADAAGVQIDELTQVSNILRGLIGDSADGITIDHQLRGTLAIGGLVRVEYSAVGDAAARIDAHTALLFYLVCGLASFASPDSSANC